MDEMDISKFSSACFAVLEEVHRTGHSVLITRSGEPLAEIVPAMAPIREKRTLGRLRSSGRILGDIVSPASGESDWDVFRQ